MGTTPPKGGLDEGVLNLERFIGILMTTIEQVQGHTSVIEEHAEAIEGLDDEAENALADLGGALEDLQGDLESEQQDALEGIGSLRDEAREGSEQRLARSESQVERAGSEFDGAMDEGRTALEQSQSTVSSEGFQRLESTMEGVESALADDRQEAEAGFEALDTAVAELQQRATGAFTATDGAFDQTVAEIADKKDAVETDAGDSVTALDQAGDDIDGECRTQAGELEGLYDGWKAQIAADAADLVDSVEDLMDDTAAFVDTVAEDQLDTPAGVVLEQAFDPYLSELATLQADLDEARGPAADELVPLVLELERALGVIDTIDQLLNALE